ncbi:MAG TPA: outer membrane protein assembly factor BamA [Bacteroidales bacterium]|nr:outer membrane protein assembly factor BamA [Bacteroidales bacterium]
MLKKILPVIILSFLSIQIVAQKINYSSLPIANYENPEEYIIKEISVAGIKYLDKNILVNLSGLNVGQEITVPGDDITDAIQKLWSQGLFSDVKISITDVVLDSISLEIFLMERNRLSELEINGVKKSFEKDIREKLELKRGMQVTENLINRAERTILDYLKEKKFSNASVDIVQIDDTTQLNNVKLKIHIDPRKKIKIKDINFYGNTVFSNGKLRRTMDETKKVNLNFFKPSKFIPDLYEEDKEKIITEYNAKGYRDAEIVRDSVYQVNEKRIAIDIEINEGDQYFFRKIDWVGNTIYSTPMLNAILKIKKGDPFDIEMLNERLNIDEDAVSNLYLDNGYLFFNVNPSIQKVENDSVDIQLRIHEGKRVRLSKVNIAGNTKTNEHVIRRELYTRPGELFSKSDIMRSQRQLAQLDYFDPEQFGIEPTNINQAEGTVDLDYSVVEKSTDQLEVSGGWGAGMFVGTLGLRFSNFSARKIFEKGAWRPIPSGDGQTLSLRAQTNGQYYSAYSFNFVEPWFGGKKPNSFSVSAYYSVQKTTNYFYQVGEEFLKIFGASIGLGQRLKWPDDYFTVSNSISYQRFILNDWGGFIINNGDANNLSLTTTFARNSTDQVIYPRSGSSFSLSLQFTPPYSLFKEDNFWRLSNNERGQIVNEVPNDYDDWDTYAQEEKDVLIQNAIEEEVNLRKFNWVEYHKWKYKGAWYLRVWDDLVLATNTEFGYLGYYNKDIGYTPFGRFNMGGDGLSGYSLYGVETIALRGYENGSLTPVDRNGKDAGNVYEKINFELRYPIALKPQATVYLLAFVEGGNAWSDIKDYNPFKIKRSAGFGLRAFLPMFGLLGVDWGYGFDNIPGNEDASGSQFHFVIGQQF